MSESSTRSRKFRVVDLFQSGVEAGQPIPDLAEIKQNHQPFTMHNFQYTSHLGTLGDTFNEGLAQSVAEVFALYECRYGDTGNFDLLVFERDNDLTFRIAVRVEQKPVADMLSSSQVSP